MQAFVTTVLVERLPCTSGLVHYAFRQLISSAHLDGTSRTVSSLRSYLLISCFCAITFSAGGQCTQEHSILSLTSYDVLQGAKYLLTLSAQKPFLL